MYPRLDGHQRRILPIPVNSEPIIYTSFSEEEKQAYSVAVWDTYRLKTTAEMGGMAQMSSAQAGAASQHTIGSTTISSNEADVIRKEVRDTIAKVFPRIQINPRRNPGIKTSQSGPAITRQTKSGVGNSSEHVIDLYTGSSQQSAPLAIAGSEVSVASTSTNPNGANVNSFSKLSLGTGAVSSPQMFATTQWKPKEPPCF